jgi:ectoine hydroxylase-related dioxygenase (phytanoyl-CoA dioxygenase family)
MDLEWWAGMSLSSGPKLSSFYAEQDLDLEPLREMCARQTDPAETPLAVSVEQQVPIYRAETVLQALVEVSGEQALKSEWNDCLRQGPGVFVVQNAFEDLGVVDAMTDVFRRIIAREHKEHHGEGDHFGTNERIWNAIQKACSLDPDLCIDYYGNPILALASAAWLGPGYQMTAQVNNVRPGSSAQAVHRDYHLGFQSDAMVGLFPSHIQTASQYLTLQGAVAHTDMSLDSGPTLLLPFSQHYGPGYLACRQPECITFFERHHSQLAMKRGDMVFFTPALMHAAGANRTAEDRLANLVQISSAFGRCMEDVNRLQMMQWVHPHLLRRSSSGAMEPRLLRDTVAAFAEGYPFPTNLDLDPPLGGCSPETYQQMWCRALEESWSENALREALARRQSQRQA